MLFRCKLKEATPHCIFTEYKLLQVHLFAFSLMMINPFSVFGLILTFATVMNSEGFFAGC